MDALLAAARVNGQVLPNFDEPKTQQIKTLADLLAVTGGNFTPKPDPDSIEAFALHLSEVLRLARTSDFVPADFYNAIGEACNDHLTNELLRDSETPEFIKFALERIAPRAAKGGGGKRDVTCGT
jgi:hypothetical protein